MNKDFLVTLLQKGIVEWNDWAEKQDERSLQHLDLEDAYLSRCSLYTVKLKFARLNNANLSDSNLNAADLSGANLENANLRGANLRRANLTGANLSRADLRDANLQLANLTGANLECAILVNADVGGANFNECSVFGLSVWNLIGTPSEQINLMITPGDLNRTPLDGLNIELPPDVLQSLVELSEKQEKKPVITVDNLQVAQYIYTLINHKNLREVIETLTTKTVLILGRFTEERKKILESLAKEVRKHNLIPIIFDFQRPTSRDLTETVRILAGMSLFVIVDITNPSSAPLELQATVPDYQIPFIPIIMEGERPFSMFADLMGKYDWVLPILRYPTVEKLITAFKPAILDRAWEKHQELQMRKIKRKEELTVEDFIKK